jgi:hypothetical protein
MDGEKLVRERGAGSRERGAGISSPIFWNFDDHGEADLLPWTINVWIFIGGSIYYRGHKMGTKGG